eukprot:3935273-Rhodomonas_salina.1
MKSDNSFSRRSVLSSPLILPSIAPLAFAEPEKVAAASGDPGGGGGWPRHRQRMRKTRTEPFPKICGVVN